MSLEIIILLSGLIFCLASFMNVIMDVVDHSGKQTIFIKETNKKIFTIPWNLWFNFDRGWLNKYENRDKSQGEKKWFKILGRQIYLPVQLSDSWHFFKMWMIFFIILTFLFLISFMILFINIQSINTARLICNIIGAFIYYSICWNGIFIIFYNSKYFIKKEFK